MIHTTWVDGLGAGHWGAFERRVGKRRRVKIAARITGPLRSWAGLVREISTSGALLSMPVELGTGDRVVVELILSRNIRLLLPATVARSEALPSVVAGPWRARVAVAFEESLGPLERLVANDVEGADSARLTVR